MGKYKEIIIPDELDEVIEYMKDVDSYREELTILGQAWDLLTILGQMGGGRTDMTTTREGFRDLTEHLIGSLGHELLAKISEQEVDLRSVDAVRAALDALLAPAHEFNVTGAIVEQWQQDLLTDFNQAGSELEQQYQIDFPIFVRDFKRNNNSLLKVINP